MAAALAATLDHEVTMRKEARAEDEGSLGCGGGPKPPWATTSALLPRKGEGSLYRTVLISSTTGHRVALRRDYFYLQHIYIKKHAQEVKDMPKWQGWGLNPVPTEDSDTRL